VLQSWRRSLAVKEAYGEALDEFLVMAEAV
jgi:hypothetical protein